MPGKKRAAKAVAQRARNDCEEIRHYGESQNGSLLTYERPSQNQTGLFDEGQGRLHGGVVHFTPCRSEETAPPCRMAQLKPQVTWTETIQTEPLAAAAGLA